MSAIDDAPDYEEGSLMETIDWAWPCCSLCNDSARWADGTECICMGGFNGGRVFMVVAYEE